MTDLGKMHYFLSIEVKQIVSGIFIRQKKYAQEVLERFQMGNCNSVQTSIVPGTKLTKDVDGIKVDSTHFKHIVWSLMYLTTTRPDLMFVVSLISRFMESPTELHFQAAKRVLRYLKGIVDSTHFKQSFGLLYKRKSEANLVGYSDSDYGGDLEDRKSTLGYVFMFSSVAVAWL
ncbi:uncharacterized protein LOC116144434 [Pistacia vera]|uniref:uncharacterized protein LOC116144434 n=1 Tax=Pistacia vera TaxID=55513 RepID=UPI001262B588|nr:uncharacterized protein LOC116144434 [Pistacia vera]